MITVFCLQLRIWAVRIIRVKDGVKVVVIVVALFLTRVLSQKVLIRRGWLIWLGEVGIMMVFR